MVKNHARKAAARATGIPKHTEAVRAVDRAMNGPVPPIPPQALAAVSVDPAAAYADDDYSFDARDARDQADRLALWEQRRDGRPTRLWTACIEVRCAATCLDEAWWRISLGYMRRPHHRVDGLRSMDVDLSAPGDNHTTVAPVDDQDLAPAERARLVDDYPRRGMTWPSQWRVGGAEKDHDIADYAAALRAGAARAAGHLGDVAARPPLPAEVERELGIWRAVHQVAYIAGWHIDDARRRAAEFADTIVDHTGRRLGRVVDVEPDDGFAHAQTGEWLHPSWLHPLDDIDDLFDDAEAGAGHPDQIIAAILGRQAEHLEAKWAAENAEAAAWQARQHVHADGTHTLSTPHELALAIEAARTEFGHLPVDELRAKADEYDYLARRVYGKVADTDADSKRIERTAAIAKALARLADTREGTLR